MLGIIAAAVFAVAFLICAANVATDAVFAPTTLIAAGLACLALHLSGVGANWKSRRRGLFRR